MILIPCFGKARYGEERSFGDTKDEAIPLAIKTGYVREQAISEDTSTEIFSTVVNCDAINPKSIS